MARARTDNPYRHPFVKSHVVDTDSIAAACCEGFKIAKATRALETLRSDDLEEIGEDPAWPYPTQEWRSFNVSVPSLAVG